MVVPPVPLLAQTGLPGGERDYGRHLRTMLADEESPTPDLAMAAAAEKVAQETASMLVSVLADYPRCHVEPATHEEPLACVTGMAVARMPPELVRTGLPAYCSRAEVDSAWRYAGCLLGAWQDAVTLMQQAGERAERFDACTPEERTAAMTLSLARTTEAFLWSDRIDSAASAAVEQDRSLMQHFTGAPSRWLAIRMQAYGGRVREFLHQVYVTYARLDDDPDRSEVVTLVLLSSLRQQYSWCLQRHPEREIYFTRLEEPARTGLSQPMEPLAVWVRNASPIDLRRAAKERLSALTGAHEGAQPDAVEAEDTVSEEPAPELEPAAPCKQDALTAIEAETPRSGDAVARWRHESLQSFEASVWGQMVALSACREPGDLPSEPIPESEIFADMSKLNTEIQAQRAAERDQQYWEQVGLQVLGSALLFGIPARTPGMQAGSTFAPDDDAKITVLKGIDSAYLLVSEYDYGLSDFIAMTSKALTPLRYQ